MLADDALRVEIDFIAGNGPVQGSVLDPAGVAIHFAGWMELIAALHSLTRAPEWAAIEIGHGQPDPA